MNIALTNCAMRIAGGENFVLHLAEGLRDRGHAVCIAANTGADLACESRARGFDTVECAYHHDLRMRHSIHALTTALRGRDIDIVHTNANHDRSVGAFAAHLLHRPCVASVHSCLSIRRNLLHWYRNKYLIDHFTPDGYSTRSILLQRDRIPPDHVTVIHNALPDGSIRYSDTLRATVRAEFDIPPDAFVIGNMGSLIEMKGQTHLLDAVALLHAPKRDVRCMIVGDGELRERLQRQAADLGIDDRLVFTGYRSDLSAIFSAFDVFALPSIDAGGETYPLVVLTALMAGLPVLASDVGDLSYLVRPEYNGYLLEPGNPVRLATALQTLIENDTLRSDMGAHSLEKARTDHRFEGMITEFESVYSRVLAAKK